MAERFCSASPLFLFAAVLPFNNIIRSHVRNRTDFFFHSK